jgi:ribosomal protein S12 methylthiotransferase
MKTKSAKSDKVHVVTLGCSKNVVDSEVLMGQLKANDIELDKSSDKDANVIIVNTCGFIDNAKEESINAILQYAERKQNKEIDKLIVTGCLSERYRDELKSEITDVDDWFGTLELPQLLGKFGGDYKHDLLGERLLTTPKHYAYVKISEGCDRPCSFCAIPLMRGKHVSKPIEQLVKEISHLVSQGIKEVMLIAQDSTFYGIDIYGERKLAELLDRISDIEGLEWIRLHYAYPSKFPMDVLPIMASKPNICKYLDIPIQHHSNNMLKQMRRGISQQRSEDVLNQIKQGVPGIALRTTLLVGHPNETEEDFEILHNFIKEYKFHRLGVFTYSHEENTHAGSLVDNVPEAIKELRMNTIMESQMDVSHEFNMSLVGKKLKVLFDRLEGEYFVGRTEYDSPEVDNEVLVKAKDNYVRLGDFANVTITEASPYDIYGDII